jgi:hypothetical protein
LSSIAITGKLVELIFFINAKGMSLSSPKKASPYGAPNTPIASAKRNLVPNSSIKGTNQTTTIFQYINVVHDMKNSDKI